MKPIAAAVRTSNAGRGFTSFRPILYSTAAIDQKSAAKMADISPIPII